MYIKNIKNEENFLSRLMLQRNSYGDTYEHISEERVTGLCEAEEKLHKYIQILFKKQRTREQQNFISHLRKVRNEISLRPSWALSFVSRAIMKISFEICFAARLCDCKHSSAFVSFEWLERSSALLLIKSESTPTPIVRKLRQLKQGER